MGVDIVLFNAIAKRRRSPSDTFLENGLGMLKTYIEKQGYTVDVVDWARNDFWMRLTPPLLARLNRFLACKLFTYRGHEKTWEKALSNLIIPFFLLSQKITSAYQHMTLKRHLRNFVKTLRHSGCRILGIKTWYGDAYVTATTLASLVKSMAPEILVIAGGPHASIYREAILEDEYFDIAVIGEGEKTLEGIISLSKRFESKYQLMKKML